VRFAALGPGAFAAGHIWVTSFLQDSAVKVDPGSLLVTSAVVTGRGPTGIAVGLGSLWVANAGDGTLVRIDIE
jgi:streptogramin lyase